MSRSKPIQTTRNTKMLDLVRRISINQKNNNKTSDELINKLQEHLTLISVNIQIFNKNKRIALSCFDPISQ